MLVAVVVTALAMLGVTATTNRASADTNCSTSSCAPPGLLDDAQLANPNGLYFATAAETASLHTLQDQAVADTISDHKLPDSDAPAVRSWARSDAEAELWGLLVQAIQAAPADRTADQQNAVDWLTEMMHRQAQEAALNAGWEFLKWAGHVSSFAARPSSADILTALQGYASGALQPSTT